MVSVSGLISLLIYINLKNITSLEALDEHLVKKGLGENEKHIETYSTCVTQKTDFLFYDIDLYVNEYLDVWCPKESSLKPIDEGKFFKSSEYVSPIAGPETQINLRNTELLENAAVKVNYYEKTKFHRFHYVDQMSSKTVKSIYFHCMDKRNKVTATIQMNLMPDPEHIEKSLDFEFDKFKYSKDGDNLTYIKSVRPGTLTKTTCKASKLSVAYSGADKFNEDYSAVKKLYNTDVEYKDISKDFVKEVGGVHTIDLTADNSILTDADRCKTVITCAGKTTRKLIYVYPEYYKLKGINSTVKDANSPLPITDNKEKGFVLDTKDNETVFINLPNGNSVTPPDCPLVMQTMPANTGTTVKDMKVTKLSSNMFALDFSTASNYREEYLSCKVSKKAGDAKESNMFVKVNPSCNISNTTDADGKNSCTFFTDPKGTIFIKALAKDADKLDFADAFYSRAEEKPGRCKDCTYTKLTTKLKPVVVKGENKVSITFTGDEIEHNPVYLVASSSKGQSEKKPHAVLQIYFTNAKTFIENDTLSTTDKVSTKSKFYHVKLDKSSVNVDCKKFFETPENLLKPVVFPTENHTFYTQVNNGEVDPKTLKGVPVIDAFKVHGYEFVKDATGYDMKINLKDSFIYSNPVKPLYFICGYNVETEWRTGKKPYAVLMVDPNYTDVSEKLCGINGPEKTEDLSKMIPCKYDLLEEGDSYPFYCPYKENGIKSDSDSFLFKGATNETYISCKYGKDGKLIEKKDFDNYLYEDKSTVTNSNTIIFSKRTPLFKKGISSYISCVCRGDHNSMIDVTNGFLTNGLKFIFLSLVLATIYNF